MKRWITLLLATKVLLMAAGCGGKVEELPASQKRRYPQQPLQIRRKQKSLVF